MTDASRWEAEAKAYLRDLFNGRHDDFDVQKLAAILSRIAAESRAEAIEECAAHVWENVLCTTTDRDLAIVKQIVSAIRALKDACVAGGERSQKAADQRSGSSKSGKK